MTCEDCGFMNIVIFEQTTGRTICSLIVNSLDEGQAWIDANGLTATHDKIQFTGGNHDEHYVDVAGDYTIKQKPWADIVADKTSISANGEDLVTFSGIPAGTEVSIMGPSELELADRDNVTQVIDDGVLEYSVDIIGTYEFTFDPFPKRRQVFRIVAN